MLAMNVCCTIGPLSLLMAVYPLPRNAKEIIDMANQAPNAVNGARKANVSVCTIPRMNRVNGV
jgi:hypothetical protein